jgi:hypothetical protein
MIGRMLLTLNLYGKRSPFQPTIFSGSFLKKIEVWPPPA